MYKVSIILSGFMRPRLYLLVKRDQSMNEPYNYCVNQDIAR